MNKQKQQVSVLLSASRISIKSVGWTDGAIRQCSYEQQASIELRYLLV